MAAKPRFKHQAEAPKPTGGDYVFNPPWLSTQLSYIAGRSHIDGVDQLAIDLEAKWGVGRLRLLVPQEWREKFDRQRLKFNAAIKGGELHEVETESRRMLAAWRKLDQVATEVGAAPLQAEAWEVALADGTVAAIVRDNASSYAIAAQGRALRVFGLSEIANLIIGFPDLLKAKETWPGATVEAVRARVGDPVADFDEEFGDVIPF